MMRLSIGITVARDARTLIAGAVALLVITACPSTPPTAPSTGSLTVTITAPSGLTPAVTVSGPNLYSKQLFATTTLTGLTVGEYLVDAAPDTIAGAIVATVNSPTITGSPAIVTAGGVANATVTYSPGTSGGLWIMNYHSQQIVQFSASQLAGTTSAAAAIAISTGSVGNFGATFDIYGDLWVSIYGGNGVEAYSCGRPSDSGVPPFTCGVNVPVAAGLAFDTFGDLWVASKDSSAIWEFYSDSLFYGSSPNPELVISTTLNSMSGPTGIAFDSHGNLWVANATGNTLVEYTAAQTSTGGALTPAITLTASGNSIHAPQMIAFDASGNLWVANVSQVNSSVVEFSAAQLAASGSPVPTVTLTPNTGSLNQPTGLAFDASGDLWVSNLGGNTVVEFTPSQIAQSGSPTPSVTVSGASLDGPAGLAFDPPPSNLPLFAMARSSRAARVSRASPRNR